jgi:hypothetical protein
VLDARRKGSLASFVRLLQATSNATLVAHAAYVKQFQLKSSFLTPSLCSAKSAGTLLKSAPASDSCSPVTVPSTPDWNLIFLSIDIREGKVKVAVEQE